MKRPQSGVALLTVLLIVFLGSLAAVAITQTQQTSIRRTSLVIHRNLARNYLLGAEDWAKAILARDLADNQIDSLNEDWASVPPALPVDGGYVGGRIEDLQGRFNLNNLTLDTAESQVWIAIFKRLLENLDLDPDIADGVADWVDEDQDTRFPGGAEDGDYLNADPPYLAANRMMNSLSELRLIRGIDEDVFRKLTPWVSALPETTTVNINTADASLLAALFEGFTEEDGADLRDERPDEGFASVDEFLGLTLLAEKAIDKDNLSVNSSYFEIVLESRIDETGAAMIARIKRNSSSQIRTWSREFGGAE